MHFSPKTKSKWWSVKGITGYGRGWNRTKGPKFHLSCQYKEIDWDTLPSGDWAGGISAKSENLSQICKKDLQYVFNV